MKIEVIRDTGTNIIMLFTGEDLSEDIMNSYIINYLGERQKSVEKIRFFGKAEDKEVSCGIILKSA